jgi:hypothetical protein
MTGSSRISTKHVVRIHANFVACNLHFRDVYDRVGKPWETIHEAPALDGNRPAMGKEILYSNG